MKTDSSAQWTAFSQNGDEFLWLSAPNDASGSTVGTSASSITLSVPPGVKVYAIIAGRFYGVSGQRYCLISSPDVTDVAAATSNSNVSHNATGSSATSYWLRIRTNTSAQIRVRSDTASSGIDVTTQGWVDARGFTTSSNGSAGSAFSEDGWVSIIDNWTYLSATTLTMPGDKSGKFSKGDKIKLFQTTAKYFYALGTSVSGILDTSGTPKALTLSGSPAINTTTFKYGTGSIRIPNQSSDRVAVTTPGSTFQFTGDFCMEGWFYPVTIAGEGSFFIINNTANTAFLLINITAANKFNVYVNSSSATFANVGTWTANTWHHLALNRSGTTVTFWVNGVSIATTSTAATLGYTSPNVVGMAGGGGSAGEWYGDDIRISNVARYTGAFTPPTSVFTSDASTLLLLQGDANTTLTVLGGDDYTLANAAITSPSYSKAETPQGFPQWFNWTPTFTGFSANPTSLFNRFTITGLTVTLMFRQVNAGTSNSTGFTMTAPVSAANPSGVGFFLGHGWGTDSGSLKGSLCPITIGGSNVMTMYGAPNNGNWTASGGKKIDPGFISYEMA